MPGLRRYDLIARGYDVISLERWLYARPRARALALLGAEPGDTVLDLGCGTGLNFPPLVQAVGDTGRVIGVDASAGMLAAAADRVRGAGWNNVTLIHDDITDLAGALTRGGLNPDAVDAVTACYNRALAAAGWACLATLIALGLNQPLGSAVAEARPWISHPELLILASHSGDFSFPSDHAVMAGAAAAGLWLASRLLGAIATVAALAMAFARVYIAAHYPWDVAAGLVFGALIALVGWALMRVVLTPVTGWLRRRPGVRLVLPAPAAEPALREPVTREASAA